MRESTRETPSHILLMSKSSPLSALQREHLYRSGWRIVHVCDPVATFAAVKSGDVDLVLLHLPVDETIDMDLPNVLRRIAPSEYLPVMVVADDAAEQQRCRYLDSGADDVICEDTSPAEMIARARALLRIKELHDQLTASRRALQQSLKRERELLGNLRRDNAHLQALCTTDPLTHVENVRSFREILNHEFNAARRYGQPISLLMLDVDHFKVVNDTHGHPSGDYVLKELAVILKRSIRDSDMVARTGGEEFSVVLPKANRRQAARFAERIRREARVRKFNVYGEDIHVTISIGSATYPDDAEIVEPAMLVYLADQALLEAKESGRDRVVALHELSMPARRRLRAQYAESGKAVAAALVEEQRGGR
jgi:two-component system cell cycle response regulator